MGNLILESLEVQNFRGFHHLQIERLGRVNLIVGKNNIGKTSLLEALQLYANDGNPSLIWQLLRARDESTYYPRRFAPRQEEYNSLSLLSDLKYLFYGRNGTDISLGPVLIGPIKSPGATLSISIERYVVEDDVVRLLQPEEYDNVDSPFLRFNVSSGGQQKTYSFRSVVGLGSSRVSCIHVAANGLDRDLVEELWDRIVLSNLEEEVLVALRIIAPGVERLSFAGDTSLNQRVVGDVEGRARTRVPIVRVEGIDDPIPLRSLGGGMQRVLGIALALVNAKDGLLLIDEFENGLYYSVQPTIWQLIFRIAERLNVQVFATTHSWDCIEGFQQAAQESPQEGLLIRLQRKQNETAAILYDEEDLSIVTRERIEVR